MPTTMGKLIKGLPVLFLLAKLELMDGIYLSGQLILVTRYRIKPRMTKLEVNICAAAPHCMSEELD